MQEDNIKLIIAISQLIQPFDWLSLPVGIIWLSYLHDKSDILMMLVSAVVCYIVFQICCYLANFLISILYLIIMPICLIFRRIKIIVSLVHIVFFTTWDLIAYWFAINIQPEYIRPISLVLYAGITLPFVYYGQKNIDTISELELTYITILKVATFISCIALLLFNIDAYVFGTVFAISYLCGLPFINDAMED